MIFEVEKGQATGRLLVNCSEVLGAAAVVLALGAPGHTPRRGSSYRNSRFRIIFAALSGWLLRLPGLSGEADIKCALVLICLPRLGKSQMQPTLTLCVSLFTSGDPGKLISSTGTVAVTRQI